MARLAGETLVREPPAHSLNTCVIVPACNEEELLPVALHSLAEQKLLNGTRFPHEAYETILLINNTTDHSREAALRVRGMYPSFQLHIVERWLNRSQAHIGYVRRLLMDEACQRLETVGAENALILSTDGDTRVAPNWIAHNREEIRCGAEAVAGRIGVSASEQGMLDAKTREFQRCDDLYRRLISWLEWRLDPEEHDPWPRHHQHFGASLAITPSAYKRAGKLPPRRYFEDIALYRQLMRNDVKLRHSNRVRVYTSARITGRAGAGLSRSLAAWQRSSEPPRRLLVESKPFLEFLFEMRRDLRRAWQQRQYSKCDFHKLSAAAHILNSSLEQEMRTAPSFGALLDNVRFYDACRRSWPSGRRLAPLGRVIEELYADFKRAREPLRTAIPHRSSS
ncbi:MAG: glycosyltransferase family 2 protein [Acidobacteriaceae bacterium]|nr:glycosyltransferase family 2 protein [Acidobacteriaceae bacterium]MBV8570397.1 glycosyltransferase family 2 protein [Acidobacteriaceae bacterium]